MYFHETLHIKADWCKWLVWRILPCYLSIIFNLKYLTYWQTWIIIDILDTTVYQPALPFFNTRPSINLQVAQVWQFSSSPDWPSSQPTHQPPHAWAGLLRSAATEERDFTAWQFIINLWIRFNSTSFKNFRSEKAVLAFLKIKYAAQKKIM